MAIYYVRSTDGNDSNGGSTWGSGYAKKTIAGALSAASSGDTIYVSHQHNFSEPTNAITYAASKGSLIAPIRIICVNDGAAPPTQLATSAIENAVNTNGVNFQNQSYIYWYGITFKTLGTINLPSGCFQIFDTCGLQLTNTSGNYYWNAVNATYNYNYHINFINTNFICGAATFSFQMGNTGSYSLSHTYLFRGCTITGTAPNNFFNFSTWPVYTNITAIGCDFSLLGTNSYLFYNHSNATIGSKFHLQNCKLSSSMNLYNNVISYIKVPEIILENCDFNTTNYKNEWYMYQGTMKNTTQVMKTGGGSSGNLGFSWNMSTNSYSSLAFPLESPWLYMWCGTTSEQRYVTVSFVHDNDNKIGSLEFWAEFEYRNNTSSTKTYIATTAITTYPLQSSSTLYEAETDAAWLTTGMTTPQRQKIQFQFTPVVIGIICLKFYLARSNYTIYIDPVILLT